MAGELERLLIKLEADTLQMRQALRDAEKSVDSFDATSGKALDRTANRFQAAGNNIESSLKRAAGAIAAYVTVSKALEALGSAGQLAQQAELAGLAAKTFQEYAYAAAKGGVEQEKFSEAMKKFAVNMGELQARGGGFYEWIHSALPTIEAQLRATKNQDEAIKVLVEGMGRLGTAADRVTLASKAFGESGGALAYAFRDGASGIKAAAIEAQNLGLILDEKMLKSAEETNNKFKALTATLEGYFKKAVVEGADSLKSFWEWLGQVEKAGAKELNTLRAGSTAVGDYADAADRAVTALKVLNGEKTKAADQNGGWETTVNKADLKILPKIPDWQTELQFDAADKISAQKRQLLAGDTQYALDLIRLETEQEIEEYRRMYRDHKITAEEFEAARSDASALASQKIKKYMDDELEKTKQNMAGVLSAIENGLTDPLRDAFDGNIQSMDKYFGSLLKNLALAINQALILKPLMNYAASSFSGSWIGDLFSPTAGRAAGGPVLGNTAYVVGEKGPEIFVPQTAGAIMANGASGGGAGGTTVYNIDARNADTGAADRIAAVLAEMERRRPSPVQSLADTRKRFPTRG